MRGEGGEREGRGRGERERRGRREGGERECVCTVESHDVQ